MAKQINLINIITNILTIITTSATLPSPPLMKDDMARYNATTHEMLANDVRNDGIAVLRGHFDPKLLSAWAMSFAPLLNAHLNNAQEDNRGVHRHYLTLPFSGLFADPTIFADEDILSVVSKLVGPDPVMCQLATDTPMDGSDYQSLHRDTPPLFLESDIETPPFQLAVNFPLCDVTMENGPFETTKATQHMARDQVIQMIDTGQIALEPITMRLGDVIIRDVRAIHRGTPNRSKTPRPMVVIGYSRSWLFRPEVHIDVPRTVLAALPSHAQHLLRHNPIIDEINVARPNENYQNFMY